MRHNRFGEVYCHDEHELREEVSLRAAISEVHATNFDVTEPGRGYCEVIRNSDGETVCHVEADTLERVRLMVEDAGLEVVE